MNVNSVIARSIAQDFVRKLRREANMPAEDELIIAKIEEVPIGWILNINSRIYLETNNPDYRICGGGDFLIRRIDGLIQDLKSGFVYP